MQTDLRRRPSLTPDEMVKLVGARRAAGRRRGWAVAIGAAALMLALTGVVSLTRIPDEGDARVETGAAVSVPPTAGVLGENERAPAESIAPPATHLAPAPTAESRVEPGTRSSPATSPTTAVPAGSPVVPCHNSTDPACGDFRFVPQPGADLPMSVDVVAEPASPRAGEPVVFRVTLTDPDGVSYATSSFNFGDNGIGATGPTGTCTRFGPWDPPAPDTARTTEVQEVRHTYAQPGTYTATFAFEPGPFDCVDAATGRGDRPYASAGTGTVSVVVRP